MATILKHTTIETLEKLLGYAFTGTVAIILWNIAQYFLKRRHLKSDRKTDEKLSKLNEVLEKVIDIRSEISFFLHQGVKVATSMQKEITIPIIDNSDLKRITTKNDNKASLNLSEYSDSEISKILKSISIFKGTTSNKVDELSKSLEIKANHLIAINLKTLDIKSIIISTHDKLPYLIRKHIVNRVSEDDLSISLKNISEVLDCAYELEDLISKQLKKL